MGTTILTPRLSVLDLAQVGPGQTPAESFAASVALAQHAEELGYERVWYAEHHNIAGIASSATSVLISHVGAHTSTIRLGAGGVMLPNHPPLVIAEQFGTLAALYPGRIDLGLGRAPGSDQNTMRALRRGPESAESFPRDIRELQGYFSGQSLIPGVNAIPGSGSHVPLYILGSSLFGAQLAAAFGLPYAFASHFAPAALLPAIAAYREGFAPSQQLDHPYVIAGINVLAADDTETAAAQLQTIRRTRAVALFGRQLGLPADGVSDEQADLILEQGAGPHVDEMLTHTALGTAEEVREQMKAFAALTGADELITAHGAPGREARLRSLSLLAEAVRRPAPEAAA